MPTAIVLGVDTPIGLTVVRELGRHNVPVIAVGRRVTALAVHRGMHRGLWFDQQDSLWQNGYPR